MGPHSAQIVFVSEYIGGFNYTTKMPISPFALHLGSKSIQIRAMRMIFACNMTFEISF